MGDSEQSTVTGAGGQSARTIGRYNIVGSIASGGMGKVYRAVDTTLGRDVALKFIARDRAADPERVQRFRHEARAASTLNHPNIVTVYELGEAGDAYYIATEYVDGETLRERMGRGPLPLSDAIDFATQIASALSAAHAAGVIHRDIKPENVMIRRDGLVKVVDFGLAKLVETDTTAQPATEDGVVWGTTRYMSPEQVRGELLDARTDLWSLGIVLFEMITGVRPFDGASRADVVAEILTKRLDLSAVPSSMRPLIEKALRRNPGERYQTAAEIAADLRAKATSPRARTSKRAAQTPPVANSVAVLPFVNLSGSADNEYLADGTTEAIIHSLAQIGDLKVVSRTSVFGLKRKHDDVRSIAQNLGVACVVEGSIRMAATRLRITARLVNATDGCETWSNTFEGDVTDVFAIQDDLSAAVRDALQTKVGSQPSPTPRRDLAVYELYVKGLRDCERPTSEGAASALRNLKEALRQDPTFAAAWGALADTYGILDHVPGAFVPSEESRNSHALAVEASNHALAIDPKCAEAHAAVGHVLTHDGDFAEAERRLRRALEINPNSAPAHLWLGVLLFTLLRHEEGTVHILKARERDPMSAQVARMGAGMFTYAGEFVRAEEFLRAAIRLLPDEGEPYAQLACVLAYQGKILEAEAALRAGEARRGACVREAQAIVWSVSGQQKEALAFLRRIESETGFHPRDLTLAWAAAGDLEKAIAQFVSWVRANPSLARVNVNVPPHPVFAPLRSDPRYHALRAEIGVPPV